MGHWTHMGIEPRDYNDDDDDLYRALRKQVLHESALCYILSHSSLQGEWVHGFQFRLKLDLNIDLRAAFGHFDIAVTTKTVSLCDEVLKQRILNVHNIKHLDLWL